MSVAKRLDPEPERRAFIPIAEPSLGEREVELVSDAVRSGWVSSIGEYVTAFEEELASRCGVAHAIATSNGTTALHLALAVASIGPDDEVIVPSLTFVATAAAVRYVGASPVLAESDTAHWCVDPEDVASRITPRTRALVAVDLYGHPADMNALAEIASEHDLVLVEDAAESLGADYRGRPAGGLGLLGVLSFYGNKLITTGEGGAVLTDDPTLAERARLLRDHAMDPKRRYWHGEIGFNYRITNMQAALGVAQLERLDEFLERKRAIAAVYRAGLEDVPGVTLQEEADWARSSWWMTTLRIDPTYGIDREEVAARLRAAGVDSRPVFVPVHLLPPYLQPDSLPVAEAVGAEGLSLPSSTSLSDSELEYVIASVRSALSAA
ncbi:MAG TPA: DegT/DnrJ/EryC1/StrS family aminotransferase [Gaiellaceae bacterium]|nr:DegT/DnrJ/EryC1/StrS family aminotransferase [Gaiellaceae bacterium]